MFVESCEAYKAYIMDHVTNFSTQLIVNISDPSDHRDRHLLGPDDTVILGSSSATASTASGVSIEAEAGPPSLHLLMAIMFGPLALVFLVSYVIHWYQVIQRIQREKNEKEAMNGDLPEHTNAARMMSIRTLENQRSGDCLLVYPSNSNNLPVIYTSVPTTKEEFKVSRDVY